MSNVPSPNPGTPESAGLFRDALSQFATGVAFVTAASGHEPLGLIVNSFSSVSLDPPLISICPSRTSYTWRRMRKAGRFAVNVLGAHHERFVARATDPGADRFAGLNVDWEPGDGGAPLLTDALASLECEIVSEYPAGDHWIVVARVERLRIMPGDDPLIFFAGDFARVSRARRGTRGRPATILSRWSATCSAASSRPAAPNRSPASTATVAATPVPVTSAVTRSAPS